MGNINSKTKRSRKTEVDPETDDTDDTSCPHFTEKLRCASAFEGVELQEDNVPEVVIVDEDNTAVIPAPLPKCNSKRLETVQVGRFKERPSSEALNILNLVRSIFEAPIVLIAIFGDQKVYVKESLGLSAKSVPYDVSICAWLLSTAHPQTLAVEDVTQDARFKANCVLRQLGVKAYCGAPLIATNGHRLGSIAFLDMKPRTFTVHTCQLLNNFAELVVRELEQDIALQLQEMRSGALQQVYSQLVRGLDCFSKPLLLLEATEETWEVLHCNQAWSDLTGMKRDETNGKTILDIFEHIDGTQVKMARLKAALKEGGIFTVEDVCAKGVAHSRVINLTFRPASEEELDGNVAHIGIPGDVPSGTAPSRQFYFMSVEFRDTLHTKIRNATTVATPRPSGKSSKAPRQEMPVAGLRLGQLIATTSYGKVYKGMWYGSDVVVQVVVQELLGKGVWDLRAVLGPQLSHPNIVSTLAVANGVTCNSNGKETRSSDNNTISREGVDPRADSFCHNSGSSVADSAMSFEEAAGQESWIVTEYCDKGTLMDGVDKGWLHPASSSRNGNMHILATLLEVASAMAYLHERGVVHANLNPCSVLLTSKGSNQGLFQRGFVSKVGSVGRPTKLPQVAQGSHYSPVVAYIAPEVMTDKSPTKEADVFSFGVLMWALQSRQRPWDTLSLEQLKERRPRLQLPANVPAQYQSLLQQCMAEEPATRPTFQHLCTALQEMLAVVEGLDSESTNLYSSQRSNAPSVPFIQSL